MNSMKLAAQQRGRVRGGSYLSTYSQDLHLAAPPRLNVRHRRGSGLGLCLPFPGSFDPGLISVTLPGSAGNVRGGAEEA
jgi:hypothetical protein